ncbi:MAG: DUF58 domain-containing protein [Ruminococcaceae bacterium]|nr:DUF58 domain-containing protein [Oscillospiraceae bacterium]
MWIISLFLALLLVALLQVWVFGRYGLRKFRYQRSFSPVVANEGDTVTMVETIRNEKLLPLPWVRIEAGISSHLVFGEKTAEVNGARQYHRSIFALGPYSTVTRRHRVYCARRGYYQIPNVAAAAGDLLGLARIRAQEIPTDSLVVVYPRLIPIEDILSEKNSFTGDIVVRRWIVDDPFMIRGVRAYTGSEPYNRINWKATARTGEMQVHEYDFTAEVRLLIVVNIDVTAEQWSAVIEEHRAERALALAASIAQYALENGIETGFATNGRLLEDRETVAYVPPQSGASQVTEIFDTIAKITLIRTLSMGTLLQQIASGGADNLDVLLITPYTDELMDRQIANMRAAGNYVEILSPDAWLEMEEGEADV